MTTDDFCFYLQKRLIQTNQTGGQWYCDTPLPLVFPGYTIYVQLACSLKDVIFVYNGVTTLYLHKHCAVNQMHVSLSNQLYPSLVI